MKTTAPKENLIGRTAAGFVALAVVFAIALFVPAGTLAYWQGWGYLAVFLGCALGITVYLFKYDQALLERRVIAGAVAEQQTSQKVIQSLAGLVFISVYIVAGLDFRFHWSQIPAALNIIGFIMVAVGFFIIFRTFKANSHTSAIIEVAEDQQVISTGPYAIVRHPMYAGAFVMLIFSPLALGSWAAMPFALLLIGVIVARLLNEEKFLRANLKGYIEYCRQVRYHLIPLIW